MEDLGIIVCVDDEKTILDSLKIQLKRNFGNNLIYEFADSALEGLDLVEELMEDYPNAKFVVIVSDWLMPGIKGDEFLIKIHEKNPQIVKIMLTGQADKEAVDRAIEQANLYKCINKPWAEQELISTINSVIH